MLVDKQTYFENHYHQRNSYGENNFKQVLEVLLFYLALLFVPFFLINFASFLFESDFFIRLEILDSSTILFLVLSLHHVCHLS